VRRAAAWICIALISALGGCGRSDTGVHIFAHLGSTDYDELQFAVLTAGGDQIVDPATTGRYAGPFRAGDQDVLVYVRDDLAGTALHCEATALQAGAVASAGAGDVTVNRGEIKDVDIFMAAPGGGDGSPPDGGSGGTPAKPNGQSCSLGTECLTGHCADGVCCESDCQMACHSCALADSPGLCRAVTGGSPDPRGMCDDKGASSCKSTGLCGVDGACAMYAAGTPCGLGSCMDGGKTAMPAGTCDGAGRCESPAKLKCPEGTSCVAGVCTGV
jgi:hypothetical protein